MFVDTKEASEVTVKVGPVEDNLTKARAVIADERDWMAHLRHGTHPDGRVTRCALGAIEHVMYGDWKAPHFGSPEVGYLSQAAGQLGGGGYSGSAGVASFNNLNGHGPTIQMFDLAIELAHKAGA